MKTLSNQKGLNLMYQALGTYFQSAYLVIFAYNFETRRLQQMDLFVQITIKTLFKSIWWIFQQHYAAMAKTNYTVLIFNVETMLSS